jgi:hypothetical protein
MPTQSATAAAGARAPVPQQQQAVAQQAPGQMVRTPTGVGSPMDPM